ncbi:hypothetical protein [Corynebacterium timonense]|uniref:Uncharacterized protein n=1 Tax=Corynebacterium timonense TaxID=441500 RepID=A0A1H1U9R0_9CORY|nr:hypothetical protein [Corynebacterium timonense]SDS69170.1 hypothetical protein SAMN04488539_2182 [Corynebacterium timonense]
MNLTSARLALRGANAAYTYFRKLDDEKQRDVYNAVVDSIKNSTDDVEGRPTLDDLREIYGAARAEAGAVTRNAHDRLDRRRADFDASAPARKARRQALLDDAKTAPSRIKNKKKEERKAAARRAATAAGVVGAIAALGAAAYAVYAFVVNKRDETPAAPAPAAGGGRGRATLVYSTTTEDDRNPADASSNAHGSAGPLGEEPAERDEELLSSLDEQLSTLDTLEDEQRDTRGTN